MASTLAPKMVTLITSSGKSQCYSISYVNVFAKCPDSYFDHVTRYWTDVSSSDSMTYIFGAQMVLQVCGRMLLSSHSRVEHNCSSKMLFIIYDTRTVARRRTIQLPTMLSHPLLSLFRVFSNSDRLTSSNLCSSSRVFSQDRLRHIARLREDSPAKIHLTANCSHQIRQKNSTLSRYFYQQYSGRTLPYLYTVNGAFFTSCKS